MTSRRARPKRRRARLLRASLALTAQLGLVACDDSVELRYVPADDATLPSPSDEPPDSCDFDPDVGACDDGFKCSVARAPDGFDAVCVPLVPRSALGEACDRSVLGYDDCERRSLCTPLGSPGEAALRCRRICLGEAVCGQGETCFRISLQEGDPWGLCVPTCDIFGDDCGGPTHCTAASTVDGRLLGVCERFGDVEVGEDCDASGQCGSGLVCRAPEGICRHYCDDSHPCPTGQACGVVGVAGASDVGVCAVVSQ